MATIDDETLANQVADDPSATQIETEPIDSTTDMEIGMKSLLIIFHIENPRSKTDRLENPTANR